MAHPSHQSRPNDPRELLNTDSSTFITPQTLCVDDQTLAHARKTFAVCFQFSFTLQRYNPYRQSGFNPHSVRTLVFQRELW